MSPVLWFLYMVATAAGLAVLFVCGLACWFLYLALRGVLTK